jgi:hypothetical protein
MLLNYHYIIRNETLSLEPEAQPPMLLNYHYIIRNETLSLEPEAQPPMLLNYHYIIRNETLSLEPEAQPPMLLNYHYIIIFCSRGWLPVGIAGFRLELQAFRLELPLRVGGVTPPLV